MTGDAVNNGVRSYLTPAQNEERRRSHSEKNEIDGDFEVQNLAIRAGTGDDDCGEPLQNNCNYRRLRFSESFPTLAKKSPSRAIA